MENTNIGWCDHTFNPWSGCAKVSAGCANCYAETLASRFPALGNWGPGAIRKRTSDANWAKVRTWNRKGAPPCKECDVPTQRESGFCDACERSINSRAGCPPGTPLSPLVRPRVFCASLGDWLDPEVPIEWLADLIELIGETPHLDWLLLTKRLEEFRPRLEQVEADLPDGHWLSLWLTHGAAPANVWLGTSVEDQAAAETRVPLLLGIPSRVRFLSCEPLLGEVELSELWEEPFCETCHHDGEEHGIGPATDRVEPFCLEHGGELVWGVKGIHWVIAGGESGPGARPMHPDWARSLRDQCEEAGVPFFYKQWGEWIPDRLGPRDEYSHDFPDGMRVRRVGKKSAGRSLDGRTWDQFPVAS